MQQHTAHVLTFTMVGERSSEPTFIDTSNILVAPFLEEFDEGIINKLHDVIETSFNIFRNDLRDHYDDLESEEYYEDGFETYDSNITYTCEKVKDFFRNILEKENGFIIHSPKKHNDLSQWSPGRIYGFRDIDLFRLMKENKPMHPYEDYTLRFELSLNVPF